MQLRYALLSSTAIAAITVLAQPTLTTSTSVPSPGADFQVNTANMYLSPGPYGMAQSYGYWNMLAPSTGNQIIKFRAASISPASAMIPSATLLSTDGGSDTLFWSVTTQGLEQVGSKTPLEGVLDFNDASLELKLPLVYTNSWSDPTGDTYSISGFPVTRTGTIAGVADAYGTLSMPGGLTYPDVLRVKVRRNISDVSAVANTVRIANIHYYYIPTLAYPVVKLVEDSVQFSGGAWSIARSSQSFGNPVLVGVDEIGADQFSFNAYPNPASDVLNVSFTEGRSATTRLEVLDALGRVVLTSTVTGDRVALETKQLRAGVYSLRAMAGDRLLGVRPLVVD